MGERNRAKWAALAFLTLLVSFPVLVGIYCADPGHHLLFRGAGPAGTGPDRASMLLQNKVLLLKDSSVTVNNTRLVYRGLEDRQILLEYYLLELDPEFPYQNRMTREAARRGIRLGDAVFQLVSVSSSALRLEIDHLYTTR